MIPGKQVRVISNLNLNQVDVMENKKRQDLRNPNA